MKKALRNFGVELENSPKELGKYLELALEGANLGIWDLYLEDNSVRFDRRWSEMLGLIHDDTKMELATWESRVHPDDIEQTYADMKAYFAGETDSYENIHRMKHVDGHWVYILVRGRFTDWDKDGRPTRFTRTHLDITNSERNKNKMSLFFEQSPFGYAFCDMDGKFLEINSRYSDILGYSLEELKVLSYWDITPKKYEADEAKQLESLKKTGRYGPYRKEYLRKDGTPVPVELNGFMLDDYDGVKGIWSTVEDITEKKNLESQLIHSSKLASLGILAAGIGHEINNPLTIISALVEKMKREYPSEEFLAQVAARMSNAIDRIVKIIAGLRTFSKLDLKDVKIFSVESVIKESVGMMEDIFQSEGVEIRASYEDTEELQIIGNRGRLQQVFMNLLANAMDATKGAPKRNVGIDLRKEGHFVIIDFTDNGCGIPHEYLGKIFDPFFTTKGIHEGTGLGLSIAYSIIQDHNGEISVESLEGKGATFHIRLPIAQVSGNEIMKPINDKSTKSILQTGRSEFCGTVLLVEDEPEILKLLAEQLEHLGLKVVQHLNGEDAFNEYLRDPQKIDIIISDLKMPKVDGLALLDKVRKKNQHHQPKFILTTAGVNINLDQYFDSNKHQFDGFLHKPYTVNEIIKLLQKCI